MKRFPWRALLYALVVLYLLLDLKWCHGPLWKSIDKRRTDAVHRAASEGWVAIVNGETITGPQLETAVARHLYQRGQLEAVIPDTTMLMIRRAVLQRLIDDTLVRQHADGVHFAAPPEEIDAFVAAWEAQFEDEAEMRERMRRQGVTPELARAELARIWSRKRWLEQRIEPGVDVTEEDVRRWFDTHRGSGEGFTEPEKMRARHIFVSTVETDDSSREEQIREAHRRVTEGGESFSRVAREVSGDPRSAQRGGDLGWFARGRVADDFAAEVFALSPGEVSSPFRTRIGWHVVEVLERKPERSRSFEEMREEIAAHLRSERRSEMTGILLKKLRTVARIQVFPENL